CHLQRPLGLAIPAGREDARPTGEGGERFNTQVYAGFLSRGGKLLDWHVSARYAGVPAVRFPADRHRFGNPLKWATPAPGDAPDLGKAWEAIIQCRAVANCL